MKLYRVAYLTMAEGSEGFTWHASRRDAERTAARWRREHRERFELDGSAYNPDARTELEALELEPTRAGILDFLNRHASAPDNG